MKIRRIPLPKAALLKMEPVERAFLLLAGHMQNELNSVHKVFAWCLNHQPSSDTRPIDSLAEGTQAMIYARVLTGKVYEAWAALERSWFATKLSQRIEPNLQPAAREALNKLKAYFSKPNAIHRVRNSLAFHYSADQLDANWEQVANGPNFEIILGGNIGNNFYLGAELAANAALLKAINADDNGEAMRAFFDEVQSAASDFTNFLEGAMLAILKDLFGTAIGALGHEEEIFPTQGYNEVAVPYFYKVDVIID